MIINILEPQKGDLFVGREEKIKELKEKIGDNGIVVVKGDRGIGKTNLMTVVNESLKSEKKDSYLINGQIFDEQIRGIFKSPLLSKISGFSLSLPLVGGLGISSGYKEPFVLEPMKKSEEKIIFVENAQELDKKALGLIFEATNRNNKLRFILEIPTPHMKDSKLKVGSYKIVDVGALDYESTIKLVKNANPKLSDKIIEKIVDKSRCYPYIARTLVYICINKNTEEQMLESLRTLRDDERYLIDDIHGQVLETLKDDAQVIIKKLAIAPPVLTWKLIEAFCGKAKDTPLSDIIGRGILRPEAEKKSYQIYHPLFRDYLREEKINPGAMENRKETYCNAMENIKSEDDSTHMLFEVLKEPDIFKKLIEISENYISLNSVGIQCYTWGNIDQAILSWSRILKLAEESKNKEWESTATGKMGDVYAIKGDLDKALEYYGKALKFDEELGYKEGMAKGFRHMGNVYRIKGDHEKALEYHEKSLKLDEELGYEEGMAKDFGSMGNVYGTKGDFEKALEYHEKSLKLDEELGLKEGMASVFGNMGNVYGIKGDFEKALKYYEKSLKLDEELGYKEGMATYYVNMGSVYQIKGDFEKALKYYEKSLKLSEELGHKQGMAIYYVNMGSVYEIKGDFEKSLEYYGKALKFFEELGHKQGMATVFGNMGNVCRIKGDLDKALEYIEKALKFDEELGHKQGMASDFVSMGIVYRIKGDLDKALEYQEKALKFFEELGHKQGMVTVFGNMGKIYEIKGDLDKSLEYQGKSLKLNEEFDHF